MLSLLPVTIRRAIGVRVPGPVPGSKRKPAANGNGNGHTAVAMDSTLSDVNNLMVGRGILIPAPYWRTEHSSINAAQVALRSKYLTRKFSVRVVKYKGGRPDMLVLRLA